MVGGAAGREVDDTRGALGGSADACRPEEEDAGAKVGEGADEAGAGAGANVELGTIVADEVAAEVELGI